MVTTYQLMIKTLSCENCSIILDFIFMSKQTNVDTNVANAGDSNVESFYCLNCSSDINESSFIENECKFYCIRDIDDTEWSMFHYILKRIELPKYNLTFPVNSAELYNTSINCPSRNELYQTLYDEVITNTTKKPFVTTDCVRLEQPQQSNNNNIYYSYCGFIEYQYVKEKDNDKIVLTYVLSDDDKFNSSNIQDFDLKNRNAIYLPGGKYYRVIHKTTKLLKRFRVYIHTANELLDSLRYTFKLEENTIDNFSSIEFPLQILNDYFNQKQFFINKLSLSFIKRMGIINQARTTKYCYTGFDEEQYDLILDCVSPLVKKMDIDALLELANKKYKKGRKILPQNNLPDDREIVSIELNKNNNVKILKDLHEAIEELIPKSSISFSLIYNGKTIQNVHTDHHGVTLQSFQGTLEPLNRHINGIFSFFNESEMHIYNYKQQCYELIYIPKYSIFWFTSDYLHAGANYQYYIPETKNKYRCCRIFFHVQFGDDATDNSALTSDQLFISKIPEISQNQENFRRYYNKLNNEFQNYINKINKNDINESEGSYINRDTNDIDNTNENVSEIDIISFEKYKFQGLLIPRKQTMLCYVISFLNSFRSIICVINDIIPIIKYYMQLNDNSESLKRVVGLIKCISRMDTIMALSNIKRNAAMHDELIVFFNCLNDKFPNKKKQQDCHELYVLILNDIMAFKDLIQKSNGQKHYDFDYKTVKQLICKDPNPENKYDNDPCDKTNEVQDVMFGRLLKDEIKFLSGLIAITDHDEFDCGSLCDTCMRPSHKEKILRYIFKNYLIFTVYRFDFNVENPQNIRKDLKMIEIEYKLNINSKFYHLTSIVLHEGKNIREGHYVTCLFYKDQNDQHKMKVVDGESIKNDVTFTVNPENNTIIFEEEKLSSDIKKNAYIFTYEEDEADEEDEEVEEDEKDEKDEEDEEDEEDETILSI